MLIKCLFFFVHLLCWKHIFIFTYSTVNFKYFFFPIQGAAIDRILGEIVHSKSISAPIDYVLCIGHFLGKVYIQPISSL